MNREHTKKLLKWFTSRLLRRLKQRKQRFISCVDISLKLLKVINFDLYIMSDTYCVGHILSKFKSSCSDTLDIFSFARHYYNLHLESCYDNKNKLTNSSPVFCITHRSARQYPFPRPLYIRPGFTYSVFHVRFFFIVQQVLDHRIDISVTSLGVEQVSHRNLRLRRGFSCLQMVRVRC